MTARPSARPAGRSSARPPDAPAGHDLMRHRWFARVMRSSWYPAVLQVPVAAVFGLVAYQLLAGPDRAHDNAGTALMWVLWWPVLPVAFLLLGRFWCAVCPFGLITDLVQSLVGANRPVPRFLKNYGIWLIDAQFLLITWADHVWGVVESPWGSGVLLLLLTTAVVASGAFLQRRAFCRYLCFLGGLCTNYGRAGMLELRADPAVCATCTARAACYTGTGPESGRAVPGCPLFSFPRTLDTAGTCSLCANCIKACPNDAIAVRVRPPTSELWFVRSPKVEESFLAMAIMGIVVVQNVTMLGIWSGLLDTVATVIGTSQPAVVFTVAFAVAVSAPVALLGFAARVAGRVTGEPVRQGFARFGYALVPLDVAAHLAHNLFHLLAEGGAVRSTVAALAGVDVDGSVALAGPSTIRVLQFALLALGVAASLYAVRRIAQRAYAAPDVRRAAQVPYAVLVVAAGALNAWLFLLPMAHRM